MTRINVGIHPTELDNDHLLAEHREMKRIPNTVASGKAVLKNIPSDFRLSSGHVKFFYNRLGYLKRRYEMVYSECVKRGFGVQYFGGAWDDVPNRLMNDYSPTVRDRKILIERLVSKREHYSSLGSDVLIEV